MLMFIILLCLGILNTVASSQMHELNINCFIGGFCIASAMHWLMDRVLNK